MKPLLLRTGCVTPARRVARRFKILVAAPHSVAISAVCTNLDRWASSNTYLDNRGSSAQIVWIKLPNDANKISCLRDRFQMLFWIKNLWKDIEKSMTSSKVGLYYFEPKKRT